MTHAPPRNQIPPFAAHYRKEGDEWQSLRTHLEGVADLAAKFASKLGSRRMGELMGLLHDLGKYSQAFQTYLKSALGVLNQDEDEDWVDSASLKGQVDHSSAGAQLAWQALSDGGPIARVTAQVIALCVASHHSGLIDCIAADQVHFGQDRFTKRLSKAFDKTHVDEIRMAADSEILKRCTQLLRDPDLQSDLERIIKGIGESNSILAGAGPLATHQQIGLAVRFLFSCLIDADRVDTANFENPSLAAFRPSGAYASWPVLIERLESALKAMTPRYAIDALRNEISDHCLNAASRAAGVYTLTVPTGGGKTLASLRFALHHAAERRLDRVIYVIPYTSIIDQNAQVVRSILEPANAPEDAGCIVLEHHASVTPERQTWQEKVLCENWDAPVVYTTMVQFLETLFGAGTRGARRMHQLANAVVIFDEIQTLPIKCVHLFNNAINFLSEQCNSTVVLCTATQPLLHRVDRARGAVRLADQHELMPDVLRLFNQLKRVEVRDGRKPGGWSDQEIVALALSELERTASVLVIVNTKSAAQDIYRLARTSMDGNAIHHLSTDMCPAHRKKVLKDVNDTLKLGQPTLCISTQLIEAGVDVDFGVVIRFLAGLDSIAQAAGRCNRNGRLAIGILHVVNPRKEHLEKLPDILAGSEKSMRILSEFSEDPSGYGDNILGPEALSNYYKGYFFERAKDMSYAILRNELGHDDNLLNLLSCNSQAVSRHFQQDESAVGLMFNQAFMTAAKIFEVIDAPTQGVVVPYGDNGREIINDFHAAYDIAREPALLRRAQQYTVNVFPHVLAALERAGALKQVSQEVRIFCLGPQHYSEQFGLSVDQVASMETLHA